MDIKIGSILSASKPEFVRKLQDLEVTERETVILEVEITSQTADVTWKKDGLPLKPTEDKVEYVKDGPNRKLLIRKSSVHDEGEYTCILDDQECSAEVTVVGELEMEQLFLRMSFDAIKF